MTGRRAGEGEAGARAGRGSSTGARGTTPSRAVAGLRRRSAVVVARPAARPRVAAALALVVLAGPVLLLPSGAAAAAGPSSADVSPRVASVSVSADVEISPGPEITAAVGDAAGPAVAAPSPAEQRRARELQKVAEDAIRDGDGSDLDFSVDPLGLGGVLWRVLLVVVIVLAVVLVVALARRGPRSRRREAGVVAAAGDGAAELERQARRAEEAGEHRAAVVLWFRAGARRLRERRRVRADETTTATQVARATGDDRVLALAVAHDRAAYGPGPVGPDASRGAREGWAAVLADRRPAGSEGSGPSAGLDSAAPPRDPRPGAGA